MSQNIILVKSITFNMRKNMYITFFLSFFMNYATIQILFFDYNFTFCLNIDENVFLCDQSLLSFNQNYSNFVHRIKFITIIKVANMQILNQYINQKMLLNFNKISVFIKIYLINNLQFDLIINMNVLNKNNIDFLLNRQALKVKNIEISFCYTSSPLSINKNNCFISLINKYKKNYYFYYFIVDYTNNDNVTKQKTRK